MRPLLSVLPGCVLRGGLQPQLLRRQVVAPHAAMPRGDPVFFICSGGVNPPGIKVLAPPKRLGRRTRGGVGQRSSAQSPLRWARFGFPGERLPRHGRLTVPASPPPGRPLWPARRPASARQSRRPRRRKVRSSRDGLTAIPRSASLRLLSQSDPLRWARFGFPGERLTRHGRLTVPASPPPGRPLWPAHRPASARQSRRPWRCPACRRPCRRRWR